MVANKDNKILIRYTDAALVNKFSANPLKVNSSLAISLQNRGFARILDTPIPNPSPNQQELDELQKKADEDAILYSVEEKYLTKIAWLTSDFADLNLRKIGDRCGFKTTVINPVNFTSGKLILSDLIIISSSLQKFSEVQLVELRAVVFQKNVPYIFISENDVDFESENVKHFLMDSQLNVFANEELFEKAVDVMGEMIRDWYVISENSYKFWRKVNEVIKN